MSDQMISKNYAHTISQLKFRPIRGKSDFPDIAAGLIASERADQTEGILTA